MQKIIFTLNNLNEYEIEYGNSETIWLLENVLTDVPISSFNTLIEFALSNTNSELAGNKSLLKKIDQSILIGFLFSDEKDGGPYLTLNASEFTSMLNQWQKAKILMPKKIIITEDHGIINIKSA